jgi:malate dehydrogenase (oxaloacetate-decarboxylating)
VDLVGQCNNAFIFRAWGWARRAEAREVTDRMFRCAAECLAQQVPDEDLAAGALYPRVRDLRRVSTRIAEAVAREARDSGVGRPFTDDAIPHVVAEAQWEPVYRPFV